MIVYQTLRLLFVFIFPFSFAGMQGRENIPEEGPFIMCANHFLYGMAPAWLTDAALYPFHGQGRIVQHPGSGRSAEIN